jgi:hypothetical protein
MSGLKPTRSPEPFPFRGVGISRPDGLNRACPCKTWAGIEGWPAFCQVGSDKALLIAACGHPL